MTVFKTWRLSVDGDLDLSTGTPVLLEGLEARRQQMTVHLKRFRGHWFLNPDVGIPYVQRVFVKGTTPAELHALYTTAILEVPGWLEVLSLSVAVDAQTRVLSVDFHALTTEGVVVGTVPVTLGG